jgi:hypothetical protein
MTLWLVLVEGDEPERLVGVWTTREGADAEVTRLAANEPDQYFSYVVKEIESDCEAPDGIWN